jgi:hypothetical protein
MWSCSPNWKALRNADVLTQTQDNYALTLRPSIFDLPSINPVKHTHVQSSIYSSTHPFPEFPLHPSKYLHIRPSSNHPPVQFLQVHWPSVIIPIYLTGCCQSVLLSIMAQLFIHIFTKYVHPSTYPPNHSFTHPPTHPVHPYTQPLIHPCIHSFVHLFTHPSIRSSTHIFIHSFIHSFIHLFIQLSTYPSTHTSTHPSMKCVTQTKKKTFRVITVNEPVCSNCNTADLYSGGPRLEPRPGHRVS